MKCDHKQGANKHSHLTKNAAQKQSIVIERSSLSNFKRNGAFDGKQWPIFGDSKFSVCVDVIYDILFEWAQHFTLPK